MRKLQPSATALAIPDGGRTPAVGIGLSSAAACAWPPCSASRARPTEADRRVWAAALGLALMAHAAVLYAMAREPDDDIGGRRRAADRCHQRDDGQLRRARIARAGAAAAGRCRRRGHGREHRRRSRERRRGSRGAARGEEGAAGGAEGDSPRRSRSARPTPCSRCRRRRSTQRKQESAAPAAGGDAARSDTASDAKASAPAAASPGAVREYARYVAQALAKTKPKGVGRARHGAGQVRDRGRRRAGHRRDRQVERQPQARRHRAEAVRHTKFLMPPAGMTPLQLTYEVPYHFR